MVHKKFRVFATSDIGDSRPQSLARKRLRSEVYPRPEAPPKSLIVEKVRKRHRWPESDWHPLKTA
jgi:hypothetical protein